MAFPVDILDDCSHEDLENSAEDYLSNLRSGDPAHPEYFSLPGKRQIPISLSMVGYVPLYGGDQSHKVLALFTAEDTLTAVALYLADQWWAIEDIVRTSSPEREGLRKVQSLGERVVLYVLNRIIYRKLEMTENEVPFLCHSSTDYAKILWKKGEAIGFYSVKVSGSICNSYLTQRYQLPVLDTMFVRKGHREKNFGLQMLEDFVDSFSEDALGLRFPIPSSLYAVCKQYLEKYPGDQELLWEVQGVGQWFQRTRLTTNIQKETLNSIGASPCEHTMSATDESSLRSSTEHKSESEQRYTDQARAAEPTVRTQPIADNLNQARAAEPTVCTQPITDNQHPARAVESTVESSKDIHVMETRAGVLEEYDITPVSTRTRSSHLRRPNIGMSIQEFEAMTPVEDDSITRTSSTRSENVTHTFLNTEPLLENRTGVTEGKMTVEVVEEQMPPKSEEKTEKICSSTLERLNDERTTEQKFIASEIGEEILAVSDGELSLELENAEGELYTLPFPVVRLSFNNSVDTSPDQKTEPDYINSEITEELSEAGKGTSSAVSEEELSVEAEISEEQIVRPPIGITVQSFDTSKDIPPHQAGNPEDMDVANEDQSSLGKEENVAKEAVVSLDKTAQETRDVVSALQHEDSSDSGLPNATDSEAPKECDVTDNPPPNIVPPLQETHHRSVQGDQRAIEGVKKSSVVVVEHKDVSLQRHSDGHKSQSEEQSEESAVEKVVESSSEDVEEEVPRRETRGLRRKGVKLRGRPRKRGRLSA